MSGLYLHRGALPHALGGAVAALLVLVPVPVQAQVATPDVSAEIADVRAVLATSAMQSAMQHVAELQTEPAEVLDEWIGLCNAYGPQGDEIYRSRHIYKLFRIYGLEQVHIDNAWNVVGVRPGVGDGPTVVLTAHHDNVALWPRDQPIEAFVADGRVWCPAASDDIVGVVQMLTVLRALNAADIRTEGDIWFVGFTGEEVDSRGASLFARQYYPHALDWRRGDILAQFHGGGGEGVSTGSDPTYTQAVLRIFTPFERNAPGILPPGVDRRWMPHAVDALARTIVRIRDEVWDPRTAEVGFREAGQLADPPVLFMNMAKISAIPIMNAPASEATVTFDLRSKSPERIEQAHRDIQRIAEEVCATLPPAVPCSTLYQRISRSGDPNLVPDFDKVNNRAARTAAAASHVLYGSEPVIDPTQGCGDCIATYVEGLPQMSFRGRVYDLGEGHVEMGSGIQVGTLDSPSRRRTTGHDVTQSAVISSLWAAVKQGLLFAVTYAGLAESAGPGTDG